MSIQMPLNATDFYHEWEGHSVKDLEILLELSGKKPKIWLAGDSSLDNKFWVLDRKKDPIQAFQQHFSFMVPDIAYHLLSMQDRYFTINTAVEESTLGQRKNNLLKQDEFLKNHIEKDDVIIVSVGGNDIACSPNLKTILYLILLFKFHSKKSLIDHPEKCWGFSYFVRLFCNRIQEYVQKLVTKQTPRLILVCMIYYPDQSLIDSWGQNALEQLGYNQDPRGLQSVIRALFEHATKKIQIQNTKVVPVALYEILDGSDTNDYISRLEPSEQGGYKMAEAFVNIIESN